MTIRHKTWALALIACIFAAPALADDREGPYVFITGGMGVEYNACKSPQIPAGASCSDISPLFRVGFGYQYSPMWALEGSYGQVGSANSSSYAVDPVLGLGQVRWNLSALALAVQAVATLHMTDNMAAFAKFGVANITYDESANFTTFPGGVRYNTVPTASTNRTNIAVGAGLRFDVSTNGSILLLGEYYGQNDIYGGVYGVNSKIRLVMGSVGLMWRY